MARLACLPPAARQLWPESLHRMDDGFLEIHSNIASLKDKPGPSQSWPGAQVRSSGPEVTVQGKISKHDKSLEPNRAPIIRCLSQTSLRSNKPCHALMGRMSNDGLPKDKQRQQQN
ncbi:hypothetical protein E4U43_001394 [Claviceps pusilla]|uniref:Uncharacterized protein n=1 Tax=Claviceps pusilla TaxID=123648 RepID=A0A9P7N914_9HYPO|nr:hypothetical protein E4U43_001394 [Claviceps pusilla]